MARGIEVFGLFSVSREAKDQAKRRSATRRRDSNPTHYTGRQLRQPPAPASSRTCALAYPAGLSGPSSAQQRSVTRPALISDQAGSCNLPALAPRAPRLLPLASTSHRHACCSDMVGSYPPLLPSHRREASEAVSGGGGTSTAGHDVW
jgi:hypothetical protein